MQNKYTEYNLNCHNAQKNTVVIRIAIQWAAKTKTKKTKTNNQNNNNKILKNNKTK